MSGEPNGMTPRELRVASEALLERTSHARPALPPGLSSQERLDYAMAELRVTTYVCDVIHDPPARMRPAEVSRLTEALEAPGLLLEQPAVQELLAERARPELTLIRGGDDA
jgi:hypothetical protein